MLKSINVQDVETTAPVISWEMQKDAILLISGNGKIPDYLCGGNPPAPWDAKRSLTETVIISEGITEIGMHSFDGYTNIKEVYLPASLRRIHAYAFRGCTNLDTVIVPDDTQFSYIYEESNGTDHWKKKNRIIFGIHSFRDVPWAIKKWGGLYIKKDTLYTCFYSKAETLIIPDQVSILYDLCLKDMEIDRLEFPEELKKGGRFICDKTVVNTALLPVIMEDCSEQMFSNSLFYRVQYRDNQAYAHSYYYYDRHLGYGWNSKGRPVRVHSSCRVADSSCLKYYGEQTKKLRIRRRKVLEENIFPKPYDTDKTFTYIDRIFPGKTLLRKIKNGKVLVGIIWRNNVISRVESFIWDNDNELVNEYLMYPCPDEDDEVSIYSDSFTWQGPDDLVWEFPEIYWTDIEGDDDSLRISFNNEMWFISTDIENYGGPLELEILENFLKEHSECSLISLEDNETEQQYRMFVPI